jgi:hypothetical protein
MGFNSFRFIAMGFFLGVGYLVSQEAWWFFTGLASICHG